MSNEPNNDRRQVADVVAERIERLIVDGVLKVGQALPSERRLCETRHLPVGTARRPARFARARHHRDLPGPRLLRRRAVRQPRRQPIDAPVQLAAARLYDLLEVRALLESESARLAALRGTDADFVLLRRRYEEMLAAHASEQGADPREHARLDHAFHLAICEASHNPVLVHTLQSLTDLMLSTVFASVNNLYHRPAQKRQIDRQHSRLYHAVIERLPEQAQRAARDHIHGIRDNLKEIEQEEQRLVRATMRLEGWT